MSAGAASIGATAAANARRRLQQEEEEELMSQYTSNDLADGWEFKFLRSATGGFSNPDILRQVLSEESRAGWILVEKFDSRRIRLKRPASAKAGDASLGFDPYRTSVGIGEPAIAVMILVGVITLMLVLVALSSRR